MQERWDDGIPRCSRDCHKDGVQVRCVTPKRWMAQPRLAKNNMRGATATAAPTAQVAKISPNGSAIIESVKILKSIKGIYHILSLVLSAVDTSCVEHEPSFRNNVKSSSHVSRRQLPKMHRNCTDTVRAHPVKAPMEGSKVEADAISTTLSGVMP